jgi:hypothetical protein
VSPKPVFDMGYGQSQIISKHCPTGRQTLTAGRFARTTAAKKKDPGTPPLHEGPMNRKPSGCHGACKQRHEDPAHLLEPAFSFDRIKPAENVADRRVTEE